MSRSPILMRSVTCDRCGKRIDESLVTEVLVGPALSEWRCPECVEANAEPSEASK